ncbi:MAG: hypothetical protein ACYC4N_25960, partial [Pirellulaceae bacterium]
MTTVAHVSTDLYPPPRVGMQAKEKALSTAFGVRRLVAAFFCRSRWREFATPDALRTEVGGRATEEGATALHSL